MVEDTTKMLPQIMARFRRWMSYLLAVALGTLLAVVSPAFAEQAMSPEERIVSKEVTGEVVYIGKRAISVEFSRTADSSNEMLLPVSGDTKVEMLRSLSELKRGDTVRVSYDQTMKESRDGGEPLLLKTAATKVTLVRRAPPEGTLQSKTGASE